MRVVADTNIYISALVFGGLPDVFLKRAFLGAFLLVTSPALLDELDETLRLKFNVSPEKASITRARLEKIAHVVEPDVTLDIIKDDPDDDRVLECAVTGKADYIVSGDRHLLKLGIFDSIPILTVRQFMDTTETGGA
jgi:putative PIN family toxin of toxin-antitoxin system